MIDPVRYRLIGGIMMQEYDLTGQSSGDSYGVMLAIGKHRAASWGSGSRRVIVKSAVAMIPSMARR